MGGMACHGKRIARIAVFGIVASGLTPPPGVARRPRALEKCPRPTHSLIPLQTRVRYTTMIVLPDGEEILDVVCGDRDFWVISATHNIAHVKPAKEGASTNLNLVTASGSVYSFLLNEKNGSTRSQGLRQCRRERAARQAEVLQRRASRVAAVRAQGRARRGGEPRRAAQTRRSPRISGSTRVGCSSRTAHRSTRSRFSCGRSGTTASSPISRRTRRELPALYEVKDGKPSFVNFHVQQGTYVVPKVLDQGYLALGKERFAFAQQGR